MDIAILVLAVALLASVFANVVALFAAFSVAKDTTLKLTALRSVDAAEVVEPRRPRRKGRPDQQPSLFDENQGWGTQFAHDLNQPFDAPPPKGNGVTGA